MKRYLLLVFVLCLFSSLYSSIDIDSGDVSGVWTKENSPYNIRGDIYVQANQLLTIEPGVKVVFHGHYRLRMLNANLIAIGNVDDTIVFTMADTNGFAKGDWNEGGWNGIDFSYAADARPLLMQEMQAMGLLAGSPDAGSSVAVSCPYSIN